MKVVAGSAARQIRGTKHAAPGTLSGPASAAHGYAAGQGGHANIRALLARTTRAVESKLAVGEM